METDELAIHDMRRLVVYWYHKGWSDADYGAEFTPPDNAFLRASYARGNVDWIAGTFTDEIDLLNEVLE